MAANNALKFQTYRLGDANGDGIIDPADATATLNAYVDNTPDGFIEAAADANKDTIIDPADATKVLNVYVGNVEMAPQIVVPEVDEEAQINEPD